MANSQEQVPTNSNTPKNDEAQLSSFANRAGNILKMGANKLTATAVAGLLTITLAGCGANANAEGPKPTTTTSAEATPNATPTKTPETTDGTEYKFEGTINLADFTGETWSNHETEEQRLKCDAFFDANIENPVKLSLESNGQDIAQNYKNKITVLQSLAADRSNPLNYEAANNIATCVAANLVTNDGGNAAVEMLQEEVKAVAKSSIEGVTMGYIEPDQITRYSDGNFPGQTDANDIYSAFAVEGYMNDGIGNQKGTLAVQYFKWVPDTEDYELVLRTPLYDGVTPDFGPKPPIEVQQ